MLELALSPYDVMRLRKATGLNSEELLKKYIIIEQETGEAFPRLYLTMVDDGRESCVFVTQDGCAIYKHRPGACRTYPLGRAVRRTASGTQEHFILVKEKHCLGFCENVSRTPKDYSDNQELPSYYRFNDLVIKILQHQAIRDGYIPSHQDVDFFVLALYNLDTFRRLLFEDRLEHTHLTHEEKSRLLDDENLLEFAINVVHQRIFAPFSLL